MLRMFPVRPGTTTVNPMASTRAPAVNPLARIKVSYHRVLNCVDTRRGPQVHHGWRGTITVPGQGTLLCSGEAVGDTTRDVLCFHQTIKGAVACAMRLAKSVARETGLEIQHERR